MAANRILVGYDGSDDAFAALQYAIAVAQENNSEIALVYAVDDTVLNSVWGVVFDPDEIKSDAAEMLAAALAEAVAGGISEDRVRTEVILGNPASTLAALSDRVSGIVVGRCSVGKGESEFAGSTAVGIAGAASCPVIVVSANNPLPSVRFNRIGVGVHISEKGRIGLPMAIKEAHRRGSALSVISVVKEVQSRWRSGTSLTQDQRDAAMDVTRIRVQSFIDSESKSFSDVPISVEIRYGSPVDILAKRSQELDLLVVEVQNTSFPTASVGGVVRGLMAHAHCPVMLVRKDTQSYPGTGRRGSRKK